MSSSYGGISTELLKSQVELAYSHGNLCQTMLLAHCLRQPTQPFASTEVEQMLRSAVIVGIDAEWYEHDSSRITELGLSILLPENFSHGDSPWDVVRKMHNFHVRIQRNAYLVNSELCEGHPENFQFGRTTFVTESEAKDLLQYAFSRRDKLGKPLPVIFVGHAVDNDIEVIKQHFNFDIDASGVVVATIDTQQMAREVGFIAPPKKMRLSHLMSKYGIIEKYLHNAGNDIVCTMITAILMAFSVPPGNHMKLYIDLKQHIQAIGGGHMKPPGTSIFCTNCDSKSHLAQDCDKQLWCNFCQEQAGGGIVLRSHRDASCIDRVKWEAESSREAANKETIVPETPVKTTRGSSAAHQVSSPPTFIPHVGPVQFPTATVPKHLQLSMPRYPFPCALCIVSPDPKRHKTEFAYSHLQQDCKYMRW